MLTKQLSEKLQGKLVDVTVLLSKTRADKRENAASFAEVIRDLEKRQRVISEALKNNRDDELVAAFGDHYALQLGV